MSNGLDRRLDRVEAAMGTTREPDIRFCVDDAEAEALHAAAERSGLIPPLCIVTGESVAGPTIREMFADVAVAGRRIHGLRTGGIAIDRPTG